MVTERPQVVTDRPRGILSPSDRRYILDVDGWEATHSRAAKSKREGEIETRTANALLDFQLLLEHFDEEDYDQVFDVDDVGEQPTFSDAHADALAFLYRLDGARPSVFAKSLERGIATAERQRGHHAQVTVSIDLETRGALGEIEQRLEESITSVSTDELCELHRSGRLTQRELAQLLTEHADAVDDLVGRDGEDGS